MKKNIFITGASSGIGKTIAEYLSKKGYNVIGTSRKSASKSNHFELIALDVTDAVSVNTAINYTISKLHTVDVLINCAGYGLFGALENSSMEEAKKQFETNFFGAVRMINAFLPHFRRNQNGLIINISSMAGLIGLPFQGHYSASKFALEGYTEALRLELKPFNIAVCSICPGDFKTTFTSNRIFTERVSPEYKEKFGQFLKTFASEEENGADPILIARLAYRLISTTKNVSVRYVVGKKGQTLGLFMKRIVGERVFEKVLMMMWKV
jgi:short-subunit dehydrogenase